jgi:hypothetical protein
VPGWRVEKVSKRDLPKEMEKIMHQVTIGITYPSEEYESVGIMKFPTECKIKIHVPNHQPDMISSVAVVAVNHHKKNVITYYHI